MSKTWHPDRWDLKLREKRGEDDWKKQIQKELDEVPEAIRVFVIINEWTDERDNTSSEVVGGKYFLSEDAAWAALDLIAESCDYELGDDETSIVLGRDGAFLSEEYRIEELNRG